MNERENSLVTTAHAVATVLETIPTASASPALLAARTALTDCLAELNDHADQQALPLPPRTRARDRVFATAAEATHVVARLILGYALAHDLVTIAGEVDFARSKLTSGRLTLRLQRMRQVHTAAIAHAAQLAESHLTSETVTDLAAKIAAAEAVLAEPRSNIAARCVATRNLRLGCTKLKRLLRFTLDPLMELHRSTDPDAYLRYQAARIVIIRSGPPQKKDQPRPTSAPTLSHPLAA